ncbi:hypothetical protein FJZ33_05070 [Candidatus Poribacteria bacterium]|nr:hypothetical protein [Candidatus Poribacteria bacterium]
MKKAIFLIIFVLLFSLIFVFFQVSGKTNRISIYTEDPGGNQIDKDENTSDYNPGLDQVHNFQIGAFAA